jgi:nucleoside-diphosphate-sugar epimerase
MSLKGATVLVTGGTGLVGCRLVEVLSEQFGTHTKVLLRSSGAGAFRTACYDVEYVDASLLDENQLCEVLGGVEYIFHCAYGTQGTQREQRQVTVEGTRALVNAAVKSKVKRFINLSSLVVFGDETPKFADEQFKPVKPWRWNYAIDKWDAEQIVASCHEAGGLHTTNVRLGVVYGPWGPAFTVGPIAMLATNRIALAANGSGVSSATYIDDAVQGIILAAIRKSETQETYIIAGADRVTWREFYAAYELMTGRSGIVEMTAGEIREERRARLISGLQNVVPAAVRALKQNKDFRRVSADLPLVRTIYAKLLSRQSLPDRPVASGIPAQVSLPIIFPPKEMIPYLSSQTEYSIRKAEAELGYQPRFDLRAGMALTEEWARWARLI